MKYLRIRLAPQQAILFVLAAWFTANVSFAGSTAAQRLVDLPPETVSAMHYLRELIEKGDESAFNAQMITPLIAFIQSPKPTDAIYTARDAFASPSAYHDYFIDADLQRIIDYTLDTNIPSFFFYPSSLRVTQWTWVDGGHQQFTRLKTAANGFMRPFILKGSEHITITPDQHTGAYYSYDVDKMVILTPYNHGKVMISIYRQQKPSAVGKKGWVLGKDDEWSYLYTQDTGLNIKGLGWADTYMYDSFGITVYVQPDSDKATVACGIFSSLRAGWAGINMVKPRHIHRGLERVAQAFTEVMENPRLPEPAQLAATFSRSRELPTPTLREYAKAYLTALERRIAASASLREKVGDRFDSQTLLEQMSRDELYAVLALDYFKKLLGRNPVMDAHPF